MLLGALLTFIRILSQMQMCILPETMIICATSAELLPPQSPCACSLTVPCKSPTRSPDVPKAGAFRVYPLSACIACPYDAKLTSLKL
jgi:hypothetical protein